MLSKLKKRKLAVLLRLGAVQKALDTAITYYGSSFPSPYEGLRQPLSEGHYTLREFLYDHPDKAAKAVQDFIERY